MREREKDRKNRKSVNWVENNYSFYPAFFIAPFNCVFCAKWARNSCHIYGNNAMKTIYKSNAISRTKDTLYKYSHPYSHPHPSSISDQLSDISSCFCWTLLELIIKIADVARGICCVAKPKVQQEKSLFQLGRGV